MKCDSGRPVGSLSAFLSRRCWRYWLAEIGILLKNPADVVTLPLPRSLRFLYPVVRTLGIAARNK
jgi:hypothetical protein